MIDTSIIELEEHSIFYLVSTKEAIQDISVYADLHDRNKSLSFSNFIERIMFHQAYCFAVPRSISGWFHIRKLKKTLSKTDHWINIDLFVEAHMLARPAEVLQSLPFSAEDLLPIIPETPWVERFHVDTQDAAKRLMECASKLEKQS